MRQAVAVVIYTQEKISAVPIKTLEKAVQEMGMAGKAGAPEARRQLEFLMTHRLALQAEAEEAEAD